MAQCGILPALASENIDTALTEDSSVEPALETAEETIPATAEKTVSEITEGYSSSPTAVKHASDNSAASRQSAVPLAESDFIFDQANQTITGYGVGAPADVVIPTQIYGVDVLSISTNAFSGRNITSVSFENGSKVASIGEKAFYNCASLSSVTLPDSLTTLEKSAFAECSELLSVTLPASVDKLPMYVFNGCTKLNAVEITGDVSSIQDYAFANCPALKSIELPEGLETIGERAFLNSGLTSVVIPDTVTVINAEAFWGCADLESVALSAQLQSLETYTFRNCTSLASITIPGSVKNIEVKSFDGCTALSKVTLEEGVESIASQAFYNTPSFTEIVLPSSITTVGATAFGANVKKITVKKNFNTVAGAPWGAGMAKVYWLDTREVSGKYLYNPDGNNGWVISKFIGDSSVTEIDFEQDGVVPVTAIDNAAFRDAKNIKTLVLPDTVTAIGNNAFVGCTGLLNCKLPSELTSMGVSAFEKCSNLTSVNIPGTLAQISDSAFKGCYRIKSLTVNNGVTSIGENAFQNCSRITTVDIPESVSEIGEGAFTGCTALQSINIPSKEKDAISGAPWSDNTSPDVYWKGTIVVDGKYIYEYNEATGEGIITKYIGTDTTANIATDFAAANVTTPITKIGANAFYGSAVVDVVLPDTLKQIDREAFSNCNSLTTVNLPAGLEDIGERAFYGNAALAAVNIPGSVKTISSEAFRKCTGLTTLTLNKGLKTIGNQAFEECVTLTAVSLPSTVTTVESYAFRHNDKLSSLTLNEGLKTIGTSAFAYNICTELTIPGTVGSTGMYSFASSRSLERLILKPGVKEVGTEAFSYCKKLTQVDMPNSVNILRSGAFKECGALEEIIFPDSLQTVNQEAFRNCTALKSVALNAGLKTVAARAFENTILEGTLKLPETLNQLDKTAFAGVTTLAELQIPYAQACYDGRANHPYGLNEANTAITYIGGTPVITPEIVKNPDGTYTADFTVSFNHGDYSVDKINRIILPNADGTTGSKVINIGGTTDTWDTKTANKTLTITQKGEYIFQVMGLKGEWQTYSVVVGAPVMDDTQAELYEGDMPNLTEEQLFFALGIIDENGNMLLKDEFGDTLTDSAVTVEESDFSLLKSLKSGQSATIPVTIDTPLMAQTFDCKVTANSQQLRGVLTWEDKDDIAKLRPESVEVYLIKGSSVTEAAYNPADTDNVEPEETKIVQPDDEGRWEYVFDVSPWPERDFGGVVGKLHYGADTVTYLVKVQSVDYYTKTEGQGDPDAGVFNYTFSLDKVIMTFNPDGGIWEDATTESKQLELLPTTTNSLPGAPTRDSHIFMGWKSSDSAYGDLSQNENMTPAAVAGKNVTFTAQWLEIHTVTYKTDGYGVLDKDTETVNHGDHPTGVTSKPNKGYMLSHFVADVDVELLDGTKINAGKPIAADQVKEITVIGNIELTAVHGKLASGNQDEADKSGLDNQQKGDKPNLNNQQKDDKPGFGDQSKSDKTPKTGDSMRLGGWLCLLLMSCLGLFAGVTLRKNRSLGKDL